MEKVDRTVTIMSKYLKTILPHKSVIHGSDVFKEIRTSQLREIILVSEEADNAHDRSAVPVFFGCLRP